MSENTFNKSQAANAATTMAYVLEGMSKAIPEEEGWNEEPCGFFLKLGHLDSGGHIGFVLDVARYAVLSEELLIKRNPEDYPGVYDYEVSIDFGAWLGEYLLAHGGWPEDNEAREKWEELSESFFNQ